MSSSTTSHGFTIFFDGQFWSCPFENCQKQTRAENTMKAHISNHLSTSLRTRGFVVVKNEFGMWNCPVCNEAFKENTSLHTHMQKHSANGDLQHSNGTSRSESRDKDRDEYLARVGRFHQSNPHWNEDFIYKAINMASGGKYFELKITDFGIAQKILNVKFELKELDYATRDLIFQPTDDLLLGAGEIEAVGGNHSTRSVLKRVFFLGLNESILF